MKKMEEKQGKKSANLIFLFAALIAIAAALTTNVSAKVFTIQNESVNMFVVNGSSGNIILNPNAGFGNVGILTSVRELLVSLVTIGTASKKVNHK